VIEGGVAMNWKESLAGFYAFLERPLYGWSRVALALLVIPLALSFTQPLWKISLEAPQYPKGLHVDIWAHTLEGGNHGQHLAEINNLNHYIGMHKIERADLSDLDWIPFALGALVLLTLRVAAIGNVRALVDLLVLSVYVGAFSGARFAYKLWVYGHNLDPTAPVKVPPFMPPLFGSKQIANFTSHSYPQLGTGYVALFVLGVAAVTAAHLVGGRRAAVRAAAVSAAALRCPA
jgi:copper chaperone NosL